MSSFLFAQEMSESFNTGDNDVNQYLKDVNTYGSNQYQFFKDNLSMKYGIGIRDIDRYVYTEKVRPADLYFACTLSSLTGKGVGEIITLYKNNMSWNVAIDELGIKPGTKEFFRLKTKCLSGIGKVRSRNMDYSRERRMDRK